MKYLPSILSEKYTVPTGDHDGAFGKRRRYDMHTGVDLYCEPGTCVYAIEDGQVVGVEVFTGKKAGSPWWKETMAILVEGKSGVLLYGEVNMLRVKVGDKVRLGDWIADVATVRKWRLKNIFRGQKPRTMLHFERYKHGTKNAVWWHHNQPQPENLLDPTSLLRL